MAQSARLAWRNLLFLFKNPRFGVVPATIYLMTAWLVGAAAGGAAPTNPWQALRVTVDAFSTHPGLALWCGGIVLGVPGLHRHAQPARIACSAGWLHSVAHFTAMFYLGWGALDLADPLAARRAASLRAALAGSRHLRRRLDCRLGHHGRLPARVGERLRPPQRRSLQRPADRRLQALPPPARRHATAALTIWPVKIERVPRRWRDRARRRPDDVAGRARRAAAGRAHRAADPPGLTRRRMSCAVRLRLPPAATAPPADRRGGGGRWPRPTGSNDDCLWRQYANARRCGQAHGTRRIKRSSVAAAGMRRRRWRRRSHPPVVHVRASRIPQV